MVKGFLVVLVSISCASSVDAQCGGAVRLTPVRSLIASRPILSTLQRVRTNAMARRMSACQGMSVPRAAEQCTVSTQVIETPFVASAVATCENGRCDIVRSTPVRSVVSSAYQQALASAQYRAANRIRGHSYLDTHRTSGVGWSSYQSNPNTCLGIGGEAYAVAQGIDGTFYATKFR